MQSAHRIVATLETIPTDLKLMIADHFGPDVPLDLRWSRVAQREARTRRGTLASLSLISRSWASALEGLRWKTLHIGARSTHRLLELARDWMPRYGANVKTVVLMWWTTHDVRILTALSGVPKIQQALDTAESLTGRTSESASPSQRAFALHDALIATVIRACPNLLTLKFRPETTTSHLTSDDHGRDIPGPRNGADCALHEFGGRISSADLSRAFTSVSANEYLNMMPNLEHLRLRIVAPPFPDSLRTLFHKLSQLPRLVSLELHNADWTALQSLSGLPCSHLTCLTLSGTLSPELRYLADVLKTHPIRSLCLRDLSISESQFPLSLPGVLAVTNLSIAGETDLALLDLFNAAPLKNVELCARRGGQISDRLAPLRIRAFILDHSASLLSFKVDPGVLDVAQLSTINCWLEKDGISVRAVTVE